MSLALETRADITTRVLRSLDQIRAITPEWRELFERSHATSFQSPDWLLAWMEVFSPETMMFVEARRAGRLIAVAPLLIYRRDGEPVLAFTGGGVSDYLDMLVEPGFENQSLQAILHAALEINESWTTLDLTDLPSHSPLLALTPLRDSSCRHDCCTVLRLPSAKDDLVHLISKRQRANLRNARSRLQRAGGGQIEIATAENVSEFLNDLFTLHTGRWSSRRETGVLADEKVRKFHWRCAPELLKAGFLNLARLRLGQRTFAVIYSLFSRQTAYCYLQGFDPKFARVSPGTQLMHSVICYAIDRELKEFDFLRGEEAYKQHWRPERRPTYRIQVSRSELAAILQKQNPAHASAA
jgi:CelD/BcsL family acetyltransferase involved in cellulose biosynthesis